MCLDRRLPSFEEWVAAGRPDGSTVEPMTDIERTPIAQQDFNRVTGEIPVTTVDPFEDDEPIVAQCDLANPETCESCQ